MKILFRQSEETGVLGLNGIRECFLKRITDTDKPTLKSHHHNGFEIHFIKKGQCVYRADGKEYTVGTDTAFTVPPLYRHRPISVLKGTEKYALTFSADRGGRLDFSECTTVVAENIPEEIFAALLFIEKNSTQKNPIWRTLAENRIFEIIVMLLRPLPTPSAAADVQGTENTRIRLAKRFIADNVSQNLAVSDVAAYCHLSTKQLSRLFVAAEGITPHTFIVNERVEAVKRLLEEDTLSLREISEKMCFNNEYYFNAFFKKHSGTTPLCYRKMHRQ